MKSFKAQGRFTNISNSKTRMHSSRMRTGRSLTVCRSLLPLGGWGLSAPGGGGRCLLPGVVSAPGGGGICSGGCLLLGGVCSWEEVLLLGRVSARGGGLSASEGVSAPGGCVCSRRVCSEGGGIPACTEADTPPVNRITDTSKNITLATTSLRPVITHVLHV